MTAMVAAGGGVRPGDGQRIALGSRVRLIDNYGEAEFTIVPGELAGAAARHLSVESRLGRALLGHRAGDRVQVDTPLGVQVVRILEVL
jgi:transcription elongation factor GreA